MHMKTLARLISLLAAGLASGQAVAAGFQLLEQNASGIGNAYAGSAAVAENASTIFFNPAGMTQLKEREVSAGLSLVRPTFKFSNRGSSTGVMTGAGDGNDAGSWAAIPNGYLSWALRKDLYVGVGFGAPFGLVTEYDNPWLGGAQAIKFDIKTYNINPSVAYRVNEKVSIGAGLSYQRMEAEYVRNATVTSAALAATRATLDAGDNRWGWNVGALFTLSPGTKVGVSYRSAIKHELTGRLSVNGPAAGASAALATGSAKAEVELPDTFILSVAQSLSDKWEMLGDVSWTGWSSIPKVDIVRTSGVLSGVTVQTLDTHFRDTWRYALGANYRMSDTLKLKFGIAYDQTPVQSAQHRLVSLPDNNRTWLSTGAQLRLDRGSLLDLGVAYLHVPESTIDNNQATLGRGYVKGAYDARVWILGAQYSMAF
ncbi:outer membrane protein transport protein [Zoogloea sp.]|uniref:OmpP1/FadL family transporter n=1 Tax=Zoogloea sp. TaxID=49181 RepID=UPI0026276DC2|nr:outer membrane protein transport protein [Zoogloea sp.]MDD3354079.1 outer membrane protein transport protein [Zoogloea sp.]